MNGMIMMVDVREIRLVDDYYNLDVPVTGFKVAVTVLVTGYKTAINFQYFTNLEPFTADQVRMQIDEGPIQAIWWKLYWDMREKELAVAVEQGKYEVESYNIAPWETILRKL